MKKGGKAALVLTGGGARAAYQVGVLTAVNEIRGRKRGNPFPIICGTSAGGINAAALAIFSDDFARAVRKMRWIWRNFHVEQVYKSDARALFMTGLRWGAALAFGWLVKQNPRALLDNSPLRALLTKVFDFNAIEHAIAAGNLYALSISASGYASGENLAFFQGVPELRSWRRAQRIGMRTSIGVEHLMATSAIPFLFPAVKLQREFFGDGSMRQLAPISPAIHLGASRILVIGSGRLQEEVRSREQGYPSPAQIAGHALSSIFLDGLTVDLERIERINQTLNAFSEAQRQEAGVRLRPIETLVITPSERLDTIAGNHFSDLPLTLRSLLGGVGAKRTEGSAMLSYLLFEPGFTRTLIDLGYQDTISRRDEVKSFLGDS